MPTDTPTAAAIAAEKEYRDWFCRQMPHGAVIGDPVWWATRTWNFASKLLAVPASGTMDIEGMVVAWIRAYGKKKYPTSTWYPTAPAEELLTKWCPQEVGRVMVEMLTALASADGTKATLLESAWGVIANAHGSDWSLASAEWRGAAERWRDEYFAALPAPAAPSAEAMTEAKREGAMLFAKAVEGLVVTDAGKACRAFFPEWFPAPVARVVLSDGRHVEFRSEYGKLAPWVLVSDKRECGYDTAAQVGYAINATDAQMTELLALAATHADRRNG